MTPRIAIRMTDFLSNSGFGRFTDLVYDGFWRLRCPSELGRGIGSVGSETEARTTSGYGASVNGGRRPSAYVQLEKRYDRDLIDGHLLSNTRAPVDGGGSCLRIPFRKRLHFGNQRPNPWLIPRLMMPTGLLGGTNHLRLQGLLLTGKGGHRQGYDSKNDTFVEFRGS